MLREYKVAVHILNKNLLRADKNDSIRINNLLRALYNHQTVNTYLKNLEELIRLTEELKDSPTKNVKKIKFFNEKIEKFIKYLERPKSSPIKAVFSDIDKTLIHKSFLKKFLPVEDEGKFMSKRGASLMSQIGSRGIPVILISGRRITSYERIMNIIPHSFAVLEHGCLVLDGNKVDTNYAYNFKDYIGNPLKPKSSGILWDYEQEMRKRGYITDSKDRISSFRIDPDKNGLNVSEQKKLLSMKHPQGIKTVRNINFIDFIPPMGGKDNAIKYLFSKLGVGWDSIACLGDDYNDLEMLSKAKYVFTHKGAVSEVKKVVKERDGYISKYSGHDGTVDMLKEVLGMIES